jgi:hypothetical protein
VIDTHLGDTLDASSAFFSVSIHRRHWKEQEIRNGDKQEESNEKRK